MTGSVRSEENEAHLGRPSSGRSEASIWCVGELEDDVDAAAVRSIDDVEEPVVEVLEAVGGTWTSADGLGSPLKELLRPRELLRDNSGLTVRLAAMRSVNELLADSVAGSWPLPCHKLKNREDLLGVDELPDEMAVDLEAEAECSLFEGFSLGGDNRGREGGCPRGEGP